MIILWVFIFVFRNLKIIQIRKKSSNLRTFSFNLTKVTHFRTPLYDNSLKSAVKTIDNKWQFLKLPNLICDDAEKNNYP
jgi:hypothetical protein